MRCRSRTCPRRNWRRSPWRTTGRTYTISTSGVRWRRRGCLAPWMKGRTGTKVSVRHLPHHDDTIEVFDAATGRHLGAASSSSHSR
ncbi:Mu transposase C-terminal domain-containing protein [Streptomyces sp. NPDC015140]|uniref:Mu transposase C-terminal domain-containing protein n=1 Tax=Streptomyces sp. NPDC015140 TaxID=3364943 RepID=UPI0037000B0A